MIGPDTRLDARFLASLGMTPTPLRRLAATPLRRYAALAGSDVSVRVHRCSSPSCSSPKPPTPPSSAASPTPPRAPRGATVTARNGETGVSWKVLTNASGRFAFVQLPLGGPYTISVARIGYRPETRGGYLLQLGSRAVVDLVMAPAPVELPEITTTGTENESRRSHHGGHPPDRRSGDRQDPGGEPQLHRPRGARADDRRAALPPRPALDVDRHPH